MCVVNGKVIRHWDEGVAAIGSWFRDIFIWVLSRRPLSILPSHSFGLSSPSTGVTFFPSLFLSLLSILPLWLFFFDRGWGDDKLWAGYRE